MRRGRNGISRRRPAFWRAGRCGTVCSRRRHSPPHRPPFGTGSGCCRRRPPAHPVPSPTQRCGNGHRADLDNLDTGATVYENAAPSQCPEGGSDGFTRRRKQPTADRGHPAGAHQLTAGGRDLAGQAEAHHTSAPASPARQPGPAGRGRPVVGARSRHRPPSPARHPCTGTCRPHRSATRHRRSGRPSSTSRPSPPLASRCGPRATRDHRRRSDHLTSLVAAGSCARRNRLTLSDQRATLGTRLRGACARPYGRRVALTPGHRRMTCGGPAGARAGRPGPRTLESQQSAESAACTARPWVLAADRPTATRPPICATSNAIFAASSVSRTRRREPAAAQRYAALWAAGVGCGIRPEPRARPVVAPRGVGQRAVLALDDLGQRSRQAALKPGLSPPRDSRTAAVPRGHNATSGPPHESSQHRAATLQPAWWPAPPSVPVMPARPPSRTAGSADDSKSDEQDDGHHRGQQQ